MKRLSFLLWLTAHCLFIAAQPGNLNLLPQRSKGILVPDTGYIQVYGKPAMQSSSFQQSVSGKPLKFPGSTKDDRPKILHTGKRPVFIEKPVSSLKSAAGKSYEERFFTFFEESADITNITDPRACLKITEMHTDKLGITHIQSVQQHKGINIYGSISTLHVDDHKARFTGALHTIREEIGEKPLIGISQALLKIQEDLKKLTVYRELSATEKQWLNYEFPANNLVFYPTGDDHYALAWEVDIRPSFLEEWKYFIDANTGEIIRKYNNTKRDGPSVGTGTDLNNMTRNFDVYLMGGIYYLLNITEKMFNPATNEGSIVTLDANNTPTIDLDYTYVTSTDNTWTQQAAISAQYHANKTYEYFDTTFNRSSINGLGGNMMSFVNVAEADGSSMENAFWNGHAVFYGNGGDSFKPLAGALDITAHEFGHGVVSTSTNLAYYGHSGAIHESFADIFACMVDRGDWLIGEDITKPEYSPSGAIRDMSNPNNMGDSTKAYWQPAHTSEMYLGTSDNGGVHINSGILNLAFYYFAVNFGKEKAEQVYYRALTEYLTQTSGFIDLRIAVIQSARDLYGDSSPEMALAARAYDAVGIYNETPTDDIPLYETNPGTEFLLTYDTKPSDPVTLYMSSYEGTNYRQLTTTIMKGKVSVTDDGQTGVFVSSEQRLRMINLDPANVNERIISGSSMYDNIAISKDGKRLAATKVYYNASIYVIDLTTGAATQFILYNPTTSPSGGDAGGVLRAFSLEWDVTGEYLIYDAYNTLNSNSLKDIYYWDIGFIKVWDNKLQDFGDGSITKLFASLPANVSVANPVFSKNSPHIVAYDYFFDDGFIEEYGIYGSNLHTGESKLIAGNDRMGYPTFSTNDERLAFSTINSLNTQVVKSIKLQPDKITPTGEAGVLVPDAKWPVFFATGTRSLGLKPVSDFTVDYKYGGSPLWVRFMDLSGHDPETWQWQFPGGQPASSTEKNPRVYFESWGIYNVTLKTTNAFGADSITKEKYITVYDATATVEPVNAGITFHPNPAKDYITITCETDFTVSIYNLQGQLVLNDTNARNLDLKNLNPGVYIMEIASGLTLNRFKVLKQ